MSEVTADNGPSQIVDEELADSAAMSADMLRSLARRWRFRIQAGRLGSHPIAESRLLVSRLEAAARLIEGATEATATKNEDGPPPGFDDSAGRLQALVDSVVDYAIYTLDPEGRITSWNTGAERIEGYRAEEVLGKHFSIFYLPEDIDTGKPLRELEIASGEGRHFQEGWRVRKGGERFWAHVTLVALRDGRARLRGFVKVTRDASDVRRVVESLRESDERLRLMIEAVRDYAIFMLDPQGHITSWNTGAERIKGYTVEEVIGRHFSIFYTDQDRRRGHPEHELAQAMATGSYAEEGWRVRKDGSMFWASVLITAIKDEHGRHVGFAKVTRDMTDRRLAEDQLRQLNEDLERRVQARTAELTAANKELEAFSYSVSHDLRAPLRALDGFSRLLLERSARLDDQERDYLQRIRAAAQRMSQLTDAMLKLSRLTRTPISRQPTDLSSVADNIIADLRHAEPERQVDVVIARGLEADCDPRLVRVVFENLLRNAWKFTRKQAEPRIEVGRHHQDGQRVFFVRDNGVGFDPALDAKLFLPFQRLHRAKDFEGTGIGLATVSRIVVRHAGRIWAEAAPGQGATFFFTLERHDAGA